MTREHGPGHVATDPEDTPSRHMFDVRFFWQLIMAFSLVTALVWGGMLLAGRSALRKVETVVESRANSTATTWADRLSDYYVGQGGWDDVGSLLADDIGSPRWESWQPGWSVGYVLAAADGTVVFASDNGRIGGALDDDERAAATAIIADGNLIGHLLVSEIDPFVLHDLPGVGRAAVRTFVLTGLAIAAGSLVVGLVISRGVSRPLVDLANAARAVAGGNLKARVPVRHRGEMGELATAFNKMTEELARAETLRRNLTADVAHELRTPLSVIRGKLEGVIDGIYPATPEHLAPILAETKVLTQLVEDLRLLTLAEAGQLGLDRRSTGVGDLLRDAHVNFSPHASDRGISLILDAPEELPNVVGDWRRIAQVVSNLVTNALRHTPHGGEVTLRATAEDGAIRVSVADTGTGIPPEDLPYIFERFWRGEKSRSRAGGGSGLGLAIAKQLVEMHGGEIGVRTRPGGGSLFWFTLPTDSSARRPRGV